MVYNFGAFDHGTEEWMAYCERLEQYFLANDVEDAGKQRAILLSVCGPSLYQLIRNLVTPKKPSKVVFKDIIELVQTHHSPPPSTIVQCFKFYSHSQKDGESTAQFVRRLSEYCEYKDTLDDMLRDHLVCGTIWYAASCGITLECNIAF